MGIRRGDDRMALDADWLITTNHLVPPHEPLLGFNVDTMTELHDSTLTVDLQPRRSFGGGPVIPPDTTAC